MAKGKASRGKAKPAAAQGREPLRGASAFEKAFDEMRRQPAGAYPDVSGRWLFKAFVGSLVGILLLVWLVYCWVFWQGSWQLLYHPVEAVKRTPASLGLAYEPVRFGPDGSGAALRTGWWVPADNARWTVLYLHGADGNLGDTVDAVAALHRAGLAVFAIDYRGYGQSAPARPSEAVWNEDAGAALDYLTGVRHLSPGSVVVYGQGLGADLAAEVAVRHASVAGVVLDRPAEAGARAILGDPRGKLVPARLLVRDRWDLEGAVRALPVSSLWLAEQTASSAPAAPPAAYREAQTPKTLVWLRKPAESDPHYDGAISRWLGDLTAH